MSDVNVDTLSGEDPEEEPRAEGSEEDAAQPPAAQRQDQTWQEEVRCDLTPDVSLPPRPVQFRSSNVTENWQTAKSGEAQAENSDDSGQGDSYTGNPYGDLDDRTSCPNRLKTEMKGEVCPGGETSRKRLVPINVPQPKKEQVDTKKNTSAVAVAIDTTNVLQPILGPADAERNTSAVAEVIDTTNVSQPILGPADAERNTSAVAEVIDTTNVSQPIIGPADAERNTSAVAEVIDTTNVPQPNLGQADINGESENTKRRPERKDQTGENSPESRGTCGVNPERESRQKSTNQNDAIQTQKQELGVELSNIRDTRMEAGSGTSQKRLTVAESIQRSKAADRSEKLQNKAQGREDELVSVQISTPGSHGVEGPSENLEQEQRTLAAQGISASKTTQRLTSAEHGSRIGAISDRTGRGLRDRVGRHQTKEGDRRNTRDGPGSGREDSGLRQEGTGDPQKGSTVAREGKTGDEIRRQQELEAVHPREDPNTGSEVARQHRPVTTPESASEKSKERVRDGTSEQGQECRNKTVQPRDGQTGGGLDQQQTAEKHTGAEDVGRSEARVSGPTPANQKEVDADPDGPCTTPVGYLLDSTEGGQNNRTKEQIIFEMSSHPCSKMLTAYGLGAQYLGYDHWQLEQMCDLDLTVELMTDKSNSVQPATSSVQPPTTSSVQPATSSVQPPTTSSVQPAML
ncbi:otolith matrix protein OMM-64-like isoform X2 [Haliotis cracherodii]|uniref:otolith matrix protein OMM-64-like isoform X2 n=1 Tax=Haliotis cracherodii TaxID=6455 RepID=UPI0039E91994